MFALVLCTWTLMGQSTANYTFSYAFNGSLQDISTGATTLLTGNNDDAASAVNNIGFTFYFMGVPYTQFSANSNGQIRLGSTATATTYSGYTASTAVIAPMSGDNEINNGMTYKVINSAPNRILVIEWNQFYVYYTNITNAGNMQALLYEGSGKIEFIYGDIYNTSTSSVTRSIFISASNTANKSGSITIGATPTYESSATTPVSNTIAASVLIANLGSTAQGSRTVYTFMPPATPADPTWQSPAFTSITSTTMTLNWNDVASNETGYLVYRSLDGSNYTLVTTTAAGATTYAATGLRPSTTYYWQVAAVNEGSVSAFITNSQVTNAPLEYVASASTGWSVATTWTPNGVPTASDNVTIPNGFTVTVDAAANTCYNCTIENGGSVVVASGTSYILTVNGNLTNNGTLDLYSSASIYAGLTFTGAWDATFSGTGATTDIYTLTSNKGSGTITLTSPTLEVSPSVLTIKGTNSSTALTGGFLNATLTGIVKFSGSYTLTNTLFYSAAGYTLPSTGGVWLNNSNFTVAGLNGSPTMNGLLRITNGTYNIGTSNGNSMSWGTGSIVKIEGGAVNATGRFGVGSASYTVNYSQSGGAITVATMQNASSSYYSFDLGTSVTSVYSLTGGTITIQTANTTTYKYDFRGASTSLTPPIANYSGGTILYLGNASTPAAVQTWGLAGHVPAGVVMRTTTIDKLCLAASVYYYGNLTIPATSELILANTVPTGYGIWVQGDVTNNGAITVGTSTSGSRFDFSNALWGGSTAQTYSGSGTFGTAASPILSVGFNNNAGVTLSGGTLYCLRNNLFIGTVTNSANITLGNGTSGAAVIQRGVSLTAVAGAYDTYPVLNLGATGTLSLVYSSSSGAIVTGYEIPGAKTARTVNNMTIINANGVTLDGNLTVGTTAAAGLLTLTTGVLNTNGYTLDLPYTGTSISGGSATSYVDGKLVRTFGTRSAGAVYDVSTLYPVGKGGVYMPMYVAPLTTGNVTISGEAFRTNSGTMGSGVTTLSQPRWEALITAGAANFTSTYFREGDGGIVSTDQILQAPSAAGVYGAISTTSTYAAGTPPTLTTTGSQILAAAYNGYFAYGNLVNCTAPTAATASFTATYKTATGFVASWPAVADASHYLVVRYASGGTPTNPVDYTNYVAGGALGTGTIRYSGNALTFVETGLTAGLTYDYYVYSFNNSGCYGPVYYMTPLMASITTCATAVGTPGTPTASSPSVNGFQASWTASTPTGVYYLLDVSTSSTFATFVAPYQDLNVGLDVLTYPVTGLSANTTYYVRVRAFDGTSCYSSLSSTLTTKTLCNPYTTIPWSENFDAMATIGNSILPDCWSWSSLVSGAPSGTPWYSANASWTTYNDPCSLPNYVVCSYYPYTSAEKYLFTPGFALTAASSYDFKFKWVGDTYAGWTGDVYVNTSPSPTGAVKLGGSFVVPATTTTNVCQLVSSRFVPEYTQTYYFMIKVQTASSAPYYLGFDDFSLDYSPACMEPTAPYTDNITTTTANLNWTNGGSEAKWDVIWGPAGFDPLTAGTLISGITAAHPYTLNPAPSGLTSNTAYDWYVRADCGDTKALSPWSAKASFRTACGVASIPYTQDFETAVVPGMPECTSVENVGTGNIWVTSSAPGYGFTSKTLTYNYHSTNDANTWFYTQGIALTGGTTYKLTYKYGNNSTTYIESLKVAYGLTALSTDMTNPLADHPSVTGGVQLSNSAYFTPATTNTYYIGFNCYSEYNMWRLFVDDIVVDLAPACIDPSNLAASTGPASAALSWTADLSNVSWDIEYINVDLGESFTGTPDIFATTDNPYLLGSLSAATNYSFKVRANCAGSAISEWSTEKPFTTQLCGNNDKCTFTVIMTDSYGDGWNGAIVGFRQGGILAASLTGPVSTGPDTAYVSLCHNYSVDIEAIAAGSYPSEVGFVVKDPWGTVIYQRTPATFATGYIFHTFTANCIPPTCLPVSDLTACTDLTTANLSWTDNEGTPLGWFVEYGEEGFALGEGTTVYVTGLPQTSLADLTAGTRYDFYVRTYCEVGDTSMWQGPKVFQTHYFECPVGSTAELEACGQDSNGGCNSDPAVSESLTLGETKCGTGWCNGSSRDTDWYEFTIGATTNVTLTGRADFGLLIGLVGYPCPQTAFITSTTALAGATASLTYQLAAGTYYAFAANSAFADIIECCNGDRYWLSITGTTCIDIPTSLNAINITQTSAQLVWASAAGSLFDLEYWNTSTPLLVTSVADIADTNYTPIDLVGSTSYGFRVRTDCGTEAGAWSTVKTFTTLCAPLSLPWAEGFESAVSPALPACWYKENGDWIVATNSSSTYDANAHTGTQFLRDSWSAVNEFVWTPGFALTAGSSYTFSFWWAGDDYDGWDGDIWTNTAQISTGATQLGAAFVVNTDLTTKTYQQVTRVFTAPTSDIYYFAIRVSCTADPWYISLDDFALVSNNKTLNLTSTFLEGLYIGSQTMNQAQGDGFVPYWTDGSADHITVELHNAGDYSITEDQKLDVPLSTTGSATVSIDGSFGASYWITIKHRNSIETVSYEARDFSGGTINFDFSVKAQAYLENMGEFIDAQAAIYAGDVNHDGIIDGSDLNAIGNQNDVFATGYLDEDVNGDGLIDGTDLNICGNNNDAFISRQIP